MNPRRILVATLFGAVMGLICWLAGVYGLGNEYTGLQVINIFAHRAILGFVIGISALRMGWAVHGLLLGFIIGLLFCLYEAIVGYPLWIVWSLVPINAIYGLLIEWLTSKVVGLSARA